MFKKLKLNSILNRKNEESLYLFVAKEMADGIRNEALWLKALEMAGGSKKKQVSEYIRLRVQSLKDDVELFNTAIEYSSKDEIRHVEHDFSMLSTSTETEQFKEKANEHDIEHLILLISEGHSVSRIENYVEGMSDAEIKKFVNSPDACEDFPLHIAIRKNQTAILEWLLEAGADPFKENYWGSSPMDTAIKIENHDAISILERVNHFETKNVEKPEKSAPVFNASIQDIFDEPDKEAANRLAIAQVEYELSEDKKNYILWKKASDNSAGSKDKAIELYKKYRAESILSSKVR